MTCIYYNPKVDHYWGTDYHIYLLDQDVKNKIDRVDNIFRLVIFSKRFRFKTVLIDIMLFIHELKKHFVMPLDLIDS